MVSKVSGPSSAPLTTSSQHVATPDVPTEKINKPTDVVEPSIRQPTEAPKKVEAPGVAKTPRPGRWEAAAGAALLGTVAAVGIAAALACPPVGLIALGVVGLVSWAVCCVKRNNANAQQHALALSKPFIAKAEDMIQRAAKMSPEEASVELQMLNFPRLRVLDGVNMGCGIEPVERVATDIVRATLILRMSPSAVPFIGDESAGTIEQIERLGGDQLAESYRALHADRALKLEKPAPVIPAGPPCPPAPDACKA